MQAETIEIGEMKKRRVVMADGRRYLIYYTFEGKSAPISGASLSNDTSKPEIRNSEPAKSEDNENV